MLMPVLAPQVQACERALAGCSASEDPSLLIPSNSIPVTAEVPAAREIIAEVLPFGKCWFQHILPPGCLWVARW
jgi:hypothetical protein